MLASRVSFLAYIFSNNRQDGVVEFSCRKLQGASFIIKPKAERLSPHEEEASETDEKSSECSVGARGAAISLGDSKIDDSYTSGDEEKASLSADDELASLDDESDDDAQNLTEEPSVLPQQSILQQIPSIKKAFDGIGSQSRFQPMAKRVLSSNTLAALNAEAGRNVDFVKRMRTTPESYLKPIDNLPGLSLGLSAMDIIRPLPGRFSLRDSPVFSSDDDGDLDKTLSEELDKSSHSGGDNSPVPLLTPPQSPLSLPAGTNDLVEWPSNLVVDNAMMSAATSTRPLSPSSLQRLEEEEEVRLNDAYSHPAEPSSLTPLLRSIYVGID